jgi:hypothetical protein
MPSLCQSFRKEAGFVWNRMQKAPRVGMSLSEETLTEFALLNIALAHARTKISIHLPTKHEEAKHGGVARSRGRSLLGLRAVAVRIAFAAFCRLHNSSHVLWRKPGNRTWSCI